MRPHLRRLRPLAPLLLAPLLAAAPTALPSYAAGGAGSHLTATGTSADDSIIRGVVTDRSGHPIDDVVVEALGPRGEVVATALSYASRKESGPQHGFYGLYVPAGHYRLRLEKAGYTRRTVGDVVVARHGVEDVRTVTLAQPRGRTRTAAKLVGGRVPAGARGRVAVTVSGPRGAAAPTGTLVVTSGSRRLGATQLQAADHGHAVVRLVRLAAGRHTVSVRFRGNDVLRPSESGRVRVQVTEGRGHR